MQKRRAAQHSAPLVFLLTNTPNAFSPQQRNRGAFGRKRGGATFPASLNNAQRSSILFFLRFHAQRVTAKLSLTPCRSFSEQIAVRSCSRQSEDKQFFFETVDQQPVRSDMALTMPQPVSCQGMIVVLFRQYFSIRELPNRVVQKSNISSAFYRQFIIPLELRCPDDHAPGTFFLIHLFSSSRASSTV